MEVKEKWSRNGEISEPDVPCYGLVIIIWLLLFEGMEVIFSYSRAEVW